MDRPWLKSYPPGVDVNVDTAAFPSVAALLDDTCGRFADLPMVECLGVSHSYAEVAAMAEKVARYLSGLGPKRGDRVAIMMPNLGQYAPVLYGVLRAGMAAVNVNPMYTPRELKHQLVDSGAKAIVILTNFAPTLAEVIGETEVRHVVLTAPTDMLPEGARPPAYDAGAMIPGAVALLDALADGGADYEGPEAEDIAFIQYTGGTTGVSKGAVLKHRNIVANVMQQYAWNAPVKPEPGARTIVPVPMYHAYALNVFLTFTRFGSTLVLITNPRDMPGFVEILKAKPFTAFCGVNTLFVGLMHTPGVEEIDWSEMRFCYGAGTATMEAVSDRWHGLTGRHICEAYGLSEASPTLTLNPVEDNRFTGSAGLPIPATDIAIRNDDNADLPYGEPGEICASGPQIFDGYWLRPEATAEVMTPDGYLRTGDIGTMDENGYIYIVDRKKDMILVSGFNVYPTEIEGVVAEMPGVKECACIGIPHEKSGEAPKIYVVAGDPKPSVEEILAHCRKNMTAYKTPREVEFVDELPKTPVGKVLRRELRS
jgi:long-chain acyl-CoA synthetase